MKKSYCCFVMLLICGILANAATPTAGKVYKLENYGYRGYYLHATTPAEGVVVKTAVTDSRAQLWYCESTGVLRSLSNGCYLSSPDALYTAWTTTTSSTTNNKFTFTESGGTMVVRRSNLSGTQRYLHADASHKCVCWESTSDQSKWIATEVSMTSAEISAALAKANEVNTAANSLSTYQNALNQLFSDKACTQLKVSNPTSSAYYSQLPDALKTMVTKVQSGNWAETSGSWDSQHARRFRVQEFKPYSRGQECSEMLGGIFHFTNMNNPTGIITTDSEVLYVMVDSEPATGSALYIKGFDDEGLYNDYQSGTQLHAGLNIIPAHGACNTYYIYYTVNTYNTSTHSKAYSLANYAPIKIHFEGGSVNGFWELDKDTNADWEYYRTRAKHTMFSFLGRFVNLHFHFNESKTGSDYSETAAGVKSIFQNIDVQMVLRAWDDMCLRERLLIGVQSPADIYSETAQGLFEPLTDTDYHNYFNNRIMACSGTGPIYMNSGHWRTQYNTNTMAAMLTGMLWGGDGMWGPAHEFGHAMQEPMNFAGTSEISNNIFSNVAVYCHGNYCSRAEAPSVHRQMFNEGTKFLDRSAFDETRMFWQLFLYYHVVGHNKQFYPRLQELLRKDPLQHPISPSTTNERYDMLHFAKKCCIAAGEDLTEFFTTWGFFIPFTETRTDYSTFNLSLTQADINTVKAEIAALGLPKNKAITFIDDRPGSTRNSYPGFNKLTCGDFGGLEAFKNPQASSASYSIVDGKIIISGNPGAGIAIYDAAGNLLDFTNSREFTVSAALLSQIQAGTAKITAITGDNKTIQLAETPDPTPLYANINRILMLVDDEGRTVGKYNGSATYALKKAYENRGNISYADLLAEYNNVINNPAARITIESGKPYHITSRAYPTLSLGLNATGLKGVTTDMEATNQTWVLTTEGDGYSIKNAYESKYAGSCARSTQVALTTVPYTYTFKIMEETNNDVYWAMSYNGNDATALHIAAGNSNLGVGWDASAEPSQWVITYVGDVVDDTGMDDLRMWVELTRDLIEQVATIQSGEEQLQLTADMFSSNACETSTLWGDTFTSWDVLLDGDTSTSFRSRYHNDNSDDGGDHYLQIDLGEGGELSQFAFNYTTRNSASGAVAPKTLIVATSADGQEWLQLTTLTTTSPTYPSVYQSEMFTSPIPARYIRLTCSDNWNSLTRGGHAPMGMSEFGMSTSRSSITVNTDKYGYVTDELVARANELANAGAALLDSKSTAVQRLDCIDRLNEVYEELYEAMQRGQLTGISAITPDQLDLSAPIFDLQGRSVSYPTPGRIYVQRGRKFLLRW